MENEKADRLRMLLQESLKPIMDRLDRIEKEIQDLKDQNENRS